MVLPILDHPQGGIHHETARIAYAIVANNRGEGFLTRVGVPRLALMVSCVGKTIISGFLKTQGWPPMRSPSEFMHWPPTGFVCPAMYRRLFLL